MTHRTIIPNSGSLITARNTFFNYEMHTLPNEIGSSIGTSTLLAACNAATYVAQIEDYRLEEDIHSDEYIHCTRRILSKRGGLWF